MQRPRWLEVLTGVLSGFALASGVAQFWLNSGTSLSAQTGLTVTLCVALVFAAWLRTKIAASPVPQAIGLFVLSAWAALSPSIFEGTNWLIGASGFDLSLSLTRQVVCHTGVAGITLLVPFVCALWLNAPLYTGLFVAIGCLNATLLLEPWQGPQGCGIVAALLGTLAFLATVAKLRGTQESASPAVANVGKLPKPLAPSVTEVTESDTFGRSTGIASLIALAASAVLWSLGLRLVRQIVADAFLLMAFEWVVLCAGLVCGVFLGTRSKRPLCFSLVLLASWLWIVLLAFPQLVRVALWENANVSQVWLLLALRACSVSVVLVPIAMTAGLIVGSLTRCVASQPGASRRHTALGFRRSSLLAVALAISTLTSWYLPVLGLERLAVLATLVLLGAAGVSVRSAWITSSVSSRFVRVTRNWGLAGLSGFAIVAPFTASYRPELAAKLLFDSGVFLAHRGQLPWEQLPVLDDARVDRVAETDSGTMTVWTVRGTQKLLRENGVPKGTFTSNARLTPRFLPDVLPALLPLTIHEQPQSVLLTGLRSGESLSVVAAFPVQRVLGIESDRGVLSLAQSLATTSAEGSPFDDDRFVCRICEPSLAIKTLKERFDVIVCSPDQPSLPAAAASFTLEHFQAVSKCLTADGLFAIRFQHVDLGPRSLRVLAKTMSTVFQHVVAVEMLPGEMLFLGTNSERGLIREGFVDRLQRAHVRQTLAAINWDWVTPLRLLMQDEDAIAALAAHPDATVNVAARSTWPFRTPTEVMSWDNKLQQTKAELAKHERFLMKLGGADGENPAVATRASEWDLARQIVRKHSDEHWAYRKDVKDHLTKSTRSMIQPVGFEKTSSGLHPEDDRRLRYFKAIGDVAKSAAPHESDLDRVRAFESPFDPLVTPFLHQEVVQLTERLSSPDRSRELRHRLAAIYFAFPGERSIRNVIDTLQFVNSNPDVIPNATERFDQLNSLLHMLLSRWTARGEFQPVSSRVALNDIERSITAAETAFATLDHLSAEGAAPRFDWEARKQVLDRRLVRPLRTYRGEVLKHYVKNEFTRDAAQNVSELPDLKNAETLDGPQ